MTDPIKAALAAIRDHMDNKTPAPCNPTFMDGDGKWTRLYHWHTLGLHRQMSGPHGGSNMMGGELSKVKASQSWAHDLMPDAYPTLAELLAAMEAAP